MMKGTFSRPTNLCNVFYINIFCNINLYIYSHFISSLNSLVMNLNFILTEGTMVFVTFWKIVASLKTKVQQLISPCLRVMTNPTTILCCSVMMLTRL